VQTAYAHLPHFFLALPGNYLLCGGRFSPAAVLMARGELPPPVLKR
jgi:hypothetical protein